MLIQCLPIVGKHISGVFFCFSRNKSSVFEGLGWQLTCYSYEWVFLFSLAHNFCFDHFNLTDYTEHNASIFFFLGTVPRKN